MKILKKMLQVDRVHLEFSLSLKFDIVYALVFDWLYVRK